MNFKPINDNVLCKVREAKSKGGLILAGGKETEFVVVAVSEKVENLNVGDLILVDKFAGSEVEIEEVKYRLFNYKQVMGVLHED